MTITSYRLDRTQNQTAIAQFLSTCKRENLHRSPQIISISLEIEPVDPLAVLQIVVKPGQRHFYFEKSGQQEAILAIDTAIELQTKARIDSSRLENLSKMPQRIRFNLTRPIFPFLAAIFSVVSRFLISKFKRI